MCKTLLNILKLKFAGLNPAAELMTGMITVMPQILHKKEDLLKNTKNNAIY